MKNGSSPGCDGLTTEFHKTFRQYIKEMLLESFERSFEVGHVSQTQKRGIVTLIHKGNKSTAGQPSQLEASHPIKYRLQNTS